MSKLILVPIEEIENRPSNYLCRDAEMYLQQNGIEYLKIIPPFKATPPPKGFFFNAANTIRNKSAQITQLATLYEQGRITNDTKIFFFDLWFPGIESLAYLNYFHKVHPKITGIIHAGSFTDTDFVRDMERWAKNFEDVVFDICSEVYCTSGFIRQDILKKRMVCEKKLINAGHPLNSELDKYDISKKENIVIFNGRICDEKQPWLFRQLQRDLMVGNWKFVMTQELELTKEEYYQLLAKSKIVVSYALQENFGVGIAEAVKLGNVPVVPDALVYKELYESPYRYSSYKESVAKVQSAMAGELKVPELYLRSPYEIWF